MELDGDNGPGLIGIGITALHDKKYDLAVEKLCKGKIHVYNFPYI